MAIITVSRGTFSGGKNLAERVAEKLGYRCVPRVASHEAALRYGVSEEKLSKVISEAPHLWERLSWERVRYLACLRAALLSEVKDSNVVYHGLAGHFLLMGVPNILRVRVIAGMEFRIKAAMDRGALSREDAIQVIRTMDDKRARWTKFLYHVDWTDPSLYDFVLNLDQISLSSACDVVCHTVSMKEYQTTPGSQKIMDDLLLSSHVRAILVADSSIGSAGIEVEAERGVVNIEGMAEWAEDVDKIARLVSRIPGIERVVPKMRVRLSWGDAEGLRIR